MKFYTIMRYSTVKKENTFLGKEKSSGTFVSYKNCARFGSSSEAINAINKRSINYVNAKVALIEEEGKEIKILESKNISPLTMGDAKKVTKKDINTLFWNNNPFTHKRKNIKWLENNRFENKKLILTKIGNLIDFHDEFEDKYAVSQDGYSRTDKTCEGCKICDEIQRLRYELEQPWMRETYYRLNYHNPRFKNENGEMTAQPTKDLALLLHDYLKLKYKGFTTHEIAEMYGIYHKQLFNILYFVSISPYHKAVGLKEPAPRVRKLEKPGFP